MPMQEMLRVTSDRPGLRADRTNRKTPSALATPAPLGPQTSPPPPAPASTGSSYSASLPDKEVQTWSAPHADLQRLNKHLEKKKV